MEDEDAYTYVDLEPEVDSDHNYDFIRGRPNIDGEDVIMGSASDHDDEETEKKAPTPSVSRTPEQSSSNHFVKTYQCISAAFELYDLKELAIADSGGKDSIVLNHFIDSYLSVHLNARPPSFRLNIVSKEEFYNSDLHIHFDHKKLISAANIKEIPALEMVIVNGLNFCHALTTYHGLQPNVRAVFTGRRQADVDATKSDERVDAFQGPTSNWPPLMRINPIASWTYQQIWDYIDANKLPYPDTYRQGYTSLGPGAQPNPLLQRSDGSYRHARELTDATRERDGRN